MTMAKLKKQLQKLTSPIAGNKADLERRLKEHEFGESNGIDDDEENSNFEADETTMIMQNRDVSNDEVSDPDEANHSCPIQRRSNEHRNVHGSARRRVERQRSVQFSKRPSYGTASLFTIKDIEGSISHFSGDDKVLVLKWIEEIEDISTLLE